MCSFVFFLFLSSAHAQDVLVGLTSNGGPEGKGTLFSMKTSGANFSILKGFADWGQAPTGDLLLGDDGNFYGMTYTGGTYIYPGAIFKMTPAGAVTILRELNGTTDGQYPYGELIKGADGNFYGLTSSGGANSYGTIFKISSDGVFTVLKNFAVAADGGNPHGHLTLAKDGNFYGITYSGGQYGFGTIFKMTPSGTYSVIHSFNKTTEGGNSYGSLTEGTDGNLYGITYSGGTFTYGTIFKITTAGVFTVLHHINSSTDGSGCQGDLIQATDGNFYGTCYAGGANGSGTIFKMTPAGVYTVMRALNWQTDGANPLGNLMQNTDGYLYGMTTGGGTSSDGVFFKMAINGTYSVLHSFSAATEGASPKGGLIKGNDGNLYGLTSGGGSLNGGTAFKITTAGALTTLADFNGASLGNIPYETLTKGRDSAYYGTTSSDGANGSGTIFKLCGGVATLLHSFNNSVDGGVPKGSLVLASDSNFYGMTTQGGSKTVGTIFRITPGGVYTVIRHLNGPTDGGSAQGSLIQGSDGNLYGMCSSAGPNNTGTIFKISLTGTFTVLHSFVSASEGANPEGNLIQAADGNLYGMTSYNARAFKLAIDGTGFTVLHSFVANTEGSSPLGSLIQAKDGNFYGANSTGGSYGGGTIFKMTSAGTVSVLKHFNQVPDGKNPKGNLLQANDGNFYGMTNYGGTNNIGTIFKITPAGTFTVLRHFTMATDGGNPFGSLILAPVNNLVANAQSVTTAEDTKKKITLTGSGGQPLSFNITSNPKHGKLTGNGANLTYAPKKNYNGADQFSFTVSVGCITSVPAIVNITVTPVNDTPVLAPIGNKTVTKDSTLRFTAKATDVDNGQTLTFSLIGAPAGASINATTGVFTWTPHATGSFIFKVRVTDNGVPQAYDEEQITVTVANSIASLNNDQQEQAAAAGLRATMYPNPVNDKFYITLPAGAEQVNVKIIDLHGAVVISNNYRTSGKNVIEVNASQLSRGVYILRLEMNEQNQTFKFIKN